MSVQNKTGMRIHNGLAPVELPKGMPLNYIFPAGAGVVAITDDLLQPLSEGQLAFVQGVWVDNADSDNKVQIDIQGTGQRLIIPSRSQGIYPVLVGSLVGFTLTMPQAAVDVMVRLILLNVPTPFAVWSL